MTSLNFAENIVALRRKMGITQEELADFVGVTKASVSKWETKQSLPDILLLPQLAAFFDVTVDELLGYEPQLSKEQIQRIYLDLADSFAKKPFDEVMEKSRELARKYYSCYPLLYQLSSLWLNHFMLADGQEKRTEVLTEASKLCGHIIDGCKDMGLGKDAVILKATIDLQLGKAQEVIEALEGILNPYRLSNQSDMILIQAYLAAGRVKEADSFNQISMYMHLILLSGSMVQYLSTHTGEPDLCKETIRRLDCLVDTFGLERLNANTAAIFNYYAAIFYCSQSDFEEALDRMGRYVAQVCYLLSEDNLKLGGDSYFYRLDDWFEGLDLGTEAPRNRKVILDGAVQAFNHPVFKPLEQMNEFEHLKKKLMSVKVDQEV